MNIEFKSPITDDADKHNCIEGAKVVKRKTDVCTRWIKEAVWARKTAPTMNRDAGGGGATDSVTCGTVCSNTRNGHNKDAILMPVTSYRRFPTFCCSHTPLQRTSDACTGAMTDPCQNRTSLDVTWRTRMNENV